MHVLRTSIGLPALLPLHRPANVDDAAACNPFSARWLISQVSCFSFSQFIHRHGSSCKNSASTGLVTTGCSCSIRSPTSNS